MEKFFIFSGRSSISSIFFKLHRLSADKQCFCEASIKVIRKIDFIVYIVSVRQLILRFAKEFLFIKAKFHKKKGVFFEQLVSLFHKKTPM